jgi:microsomal dipeptidase-like Zn-dependent dipeptidase
MSPIARKQYYDYIADKKKTSGLNIPVICSHASVGDAPSLDYFINPAKDNKKDKNKNYFNTSSLSLNDEDIKIIIDSDGIIGIVLHEGRIASKDAMKEEIYGIHEHRKEIKRAQNKIKTVQFELQKDLSDKRKQKLLGKVNEKMREIDQHGNSIREGFANMVLANMYKIVEVYSKHKPANAAKGWDHIGIGSDFDGMINKLDYLGTANEFPELEKLIIKFLKNPQPLDKFDPSWTKSRLKTLQFGYSAEALAEKIMGKNADEFLRKYFNEDYLINGKNPKVATDKPLMA